MCGFIGYMGENNCGIHELAHEMSSVIVHRGPDDAGYYFDDDVHLGFRRLSIIDIESGHQPLAFANRFWITFNGEIYNYIELRNELIAIGYTFQTESDTEVIVALYSHLGKNAVYKLRGMFSFVIWDQEKRELFGARDHFGIKPFYYYEDEEDFYFASEKKSILIALQHDSDLDLQSLHHYLTYQYVPEPHTLAKEIKRLEPGRFFMKKAGQPMEIEVFFKPSFCPKVDSFQKTTNKIQDVLKDSVSMHMRSDVPVGAFLSGGIDSTSIVALAKETNPNIKTFTVGFEREGFSEIDLAQETAYELGVENISYVISVDEFIKELPRIIWHLDDPVADPALVPLYFLAREASKHVKVVLSGEGADELFGGYNIYREPYALKYFRYMPSLLKKECKTFAGLLPNWVKGKSFLERGATSIEKRYIGNAKIFQEAEKQELLKNYHPNWQYDNVTKALYQQVPHLHDIQKMQFIDLHTWLPGDILVKADRMTMAHSLELRVPFLDKEVFTVASQLDHTVTVTNSQTKYSLRKAMEGLIPTLVLNRKKLGFPVPIRHWLREEMFDWAYQLIIESRTDYLFEKNLILFLLSEHQKGKKDNSRKLWTVIVFMIWHEIYMEGKLPFETKEKVLQHS
ncbi:asparagine synthase (glutamine-hydrolyzing) [Robertmurraya sp. FSL W8-0741]|uniref:asparagine synthase (glutamine-hydrolyzing) n=1 Tax=Robertmurraya sp. FSL W8-0741 TaxID=2954629 RepID=UPI0030FA5283